MPDRIIDCCSFLNLYAGWAGLEPLRPLPHTWHICEVGYAESEFTREYGNDGTLIDAPLDLNPLIDSDLLKITRPETDAELADYVNFSQEVDDGEAQALAIAKHRAYVLLTDDRKASRIAARPEVAIATLTTVGVLREWQQHNQIEPDALRAVVKRISVLARFTPPKNTPDWQWWQAQLQSI
jgi:hypothetical protein